MGTAAARDFAAIASVAAEIAIQAGEVLSAGRGAARTSVETKSTGTDMVTEIDRASETLITRLLAEHRPGDGLIGEEGAAVPSSTGITWVVDPLDGTTNYLYDFPAFCVSIAAEIDGRSVAAAVHDPAHDETFVASRGNGATCNGAPLRVRSTASLATALVGTGFSYLPQQRAVQARRLPVVLPAVRDIRRAGAAALDLCWLAAGRLDGYYEWGLQPWDWAGGSLVATEAGCVTGRLDDGTYVAAHPEVFEDLMGLLVRSAGQAVPEPAPHHLTSRRDS